MQNFPRRDWRVWIVTLSAIAALTLMYSLRSVFNPFLLALALAYIMEPMVKALERRRIPRSVTIAGMFIGIAIGLLVTVLVLVPKIAREASDWQIEVIGENFYDYNRNGRYDTKPSSETYTDVNGNGKYDEPESYKDVNENGIYDRISERGTWVDQNGNNRFDEGDTYEDLNRNGSFDASVPADILEDVNGNGEWDKGEPFVDSNGNGKYDAELPPDKWDRFVHDSNHNGRFDEGYFAKLKQRVAVELEEDGALRRQLSKVMEPEEIDSLLADTMATARGSLHSLFGNVGNIVKTAWESGLKGVGWLWDMALLLILTPIYLAFFLYSLDKAWDTCKAYLPGRIKDRTLDILHKIDLVISAFFRGRLLVCTAIGLFTAIGFAICGVRFGVMFGLLIGIMSFIPFLNILAFIPALLSCWMAEFTVWQYVAVIGVYSVGQWLDPLLTSLILGKDLQLHPVSILLSLFACSALFGLFGMLLAVPIVAAGKILAKEFILPSLDALAREYPHQPEDTDT